MQKSLAFRFIREGWLKMCALVSYIEHFGREKKTKQISQNCAMVQFGISSGFTPQTDVLDLRAALQTSSANPRSSVTARTISKLQH